MPNQQFGHQEWLSRFNEHLVKERYTPNTVSRYTGAATRFLSFLKMHNIGLLAAQSADLEQYLQHELNAYGQRYRRRVPVCRWRSDQLRPIHHLLRLAQGRWPQSAFNPGQTVSHEICTQYAEWMTDLRGLAQKTVLGRCQEARNFLGWWEKRSGQAGVALLTVADVDQYMKERAATLRRTGLKSVANTLRSFLRWLHRLRTNPARSFYGVDRAIAICI